MLVGYARVSTEEQNLQLQLDALNKIGCEKIFQEKVSGSIQNRPELMLALEYLRSGDTLVVWKLDRLARSIKQLIQTIELLDSKQIGLLSITESIDTNTSGGRLVFHIFASLAEFERSIIKERTMAGLLAARKLGRKGGRPSIIEPTDLAIAKTLLKDRTIKVNDIAKKMNISRSTLYRHIPGGREFEGI